MLPIPTPPETHVRIPPCGGAAARGPAADDDQGDGLNARVRTDEDDLCALCLRNLLLGRHRGQEVEFSYLIMFPALGFHLIPSGGVRWKSDNLVDYYYGVKPGEARPDRPAYEGEQAFDPFLRLVVRRKLTKHWSLFSDARYEWLAREITNSPIVGKDYQFSMATGVLYA